MATSELITSRAVSQRSTQRTSIARTSLLRVFAGVCLLAAFIFFGLTTPAGAQLYAGGSDRN
jgi:hypothetical protein